MFVFRRIVGTIFLCITVMASYAQVGSVEFKDENLVSILQTIEQKTALVFNFNPDFLSVYRYSGELNLDVPSEFLPKLLRKTPFDFENTGEVVLIFPAPPETYNICGKVTDALTGESLPFANIYIQTKEKTIGTQANEYGRFELQCSVLRTEEVTLSFIGYLTEKRTIQDFPINDCMDISLSLNEDLFGEGIVVTDYLLKGIELGEQYGGIQMDYGNTFNQLTQIEQDLLRAVQLMPGITSIDGSASNIQIRGGTADQNLMLWEGAVVYSPGHLFGMVSTINPFVIDKVNIYKGVFDPSYDNRVGGTIDMSLSDSITSELQLGVGTTFTEAHGFLELPVISDRLSLLVAGRQTLNNIWETPTLVNYQTKVFQNTRVDMEEEEEQDTEQRLVYNDINAKVIVRPHKDWLVEGAIFQNRNDFNFFSGFFDDEVRANDVVEFGSTLVSGQITGHISPNWESRISYVQSLYDSDKAFILTTIPEEEIEYSSESTNRVRDQTFTFQNDMNLSATTRWQWGYQVSQKSVDFDLIVHEPEAGLIYEQIESESFSSLIHAGFSSFKWKTDQWQLDAGLRVNFERGITVPAFSPRLNIFYVLDEGWRLKVSGGILQQYINQVNTFGDDQVGVLNETWVLTRSSTDSYQEAKKGAVGLIFKEKGWLIDWELYTNQVNGLTTFSPSFRNEQDLDFSFGSSVAKGMDLLIRKKIGGYQCWVNYSLSKVVYDFPDIYESRFRASNDHPHNLSVVNTYQKGPWSFSLNYQFRSGLPFSVPVGWTGYQQINPEEPEEFLLNHRDVRYGELNTSRLPNTSRLDLGVNYQHAFPISGIQLNLSFSLINVLDRINIFSRTYFIEDFGEGTNFQIDPLDKYLLPRTPQLLVNLRF